MYFHCCFVLTVRSATKNDGTTQDADVLPKPLKYSVRIHYSFTNKTMDGYAFINLKALNPCRGVSRRDSAEFTGTGYK